MQLFRCLCRRNMIETQNKKKTKWYIWVIVLLPVIAGVSFLVYKSLSYHPIKDVVVWEAGETGFAAELFKTDPDDNFELDCNISSIDFQTVGRYKIDITVRNRIYSSVLQVVDTTAPAAESVMKQIYNFETVTAEELVSNVTDISEVAIDFVGDPDLHTVGTRAVQISITDIFGNQSIVTSELTVIKDLIAPVFSEMEDLVVCIGDTISYKKGVSVTDNRDASVDFSIDSSQVNTDIIGTYTATYTATDSDGNTTTVERKVVIQDKPVIDYELVEAMAQDVIAKIISADMSDHQIIDTIFKWVKRNMTYTSSSETDIPNAAYVGFTKKRGDCYNYFAVTKLLLDCCDIENMEVQRYNASSSHYWLLVNIGTGWYHYDTTPQHKLYPYSCFMKTDEEIWEYASNRGDGRTDYYNFDTSLYPDRATEKYTAP